MRRSGQVVALQEQTATIEIAAVAGCGHCSHQVHCTQSLLPLKNTLQVLVNNVSAARIGDVVTIELPDPPSAWIWLVLGAYGLPTLGLMAGACLAAFTPFALSNEFNGDVMVSIGVVSGLFGGLLAWHMVRPLVEKGLAAKLRSTNISVARLDSRPGLESESGKDT